MPPRTSINTTVTIEPDKQITTIMMVCSNCRKVVKPKRMDLTKYKVKCVECGLEEEKDILEVGNVI